MKDIYNIKLNVLFVTITNNDYFIKLFVLLKLFVLYLYHQNETITIKTNIMKATAQQIITYTNERLNDWYKEAKEYGVKGAAIAFLLNDQIVIDYVENGVTAIFSLNHFEGEAIDYVFNVWSEEADLQVDKVF